MKLALIGAGQRGMIYAEYAYFKKGVEIIAVVEPNEERRVIAAEKLSIGEENQFACVEDFFAKEKMCDAIIIASMDQDHYTQTMKALECGYDILLEKPISPSPKQCIEICEAAERKGVRVLVCHVLRYTSFFRKLKVLY